MKFIHTSDLHLGRKLNDISLISDQKYILDNICLLCKENNVDFLLISGDIYDKSVPSNEAMMLFDEFINKLVSLNIKVFAISGNHDSDCKISYFSNLLKKSDIYMSEVFNGRLEKYTLDDEYGFYNIYLLPFVKPQNVRRFYDDVIETYDDAVKVIIKNANIDYSQRNIILAHQFITGAISSDSEISLGGIENVNVGCFLDFDYVALGHIHRPQKLLKDTIRYSGSIFKYSISEENNKKTVSLVNINAKGDYSINQLELKSLNDVRTIKGLFSDLMNLEKSNDYVNVIVTDEDVLIDCKEQLLTLFPNMIKFSVENSKTINSNYESSNIEVKSLSFTDLLNEFYKMQNNDKELSSEALKIVNEIFEDIGGNV